MKYVSLITLASLSMCAGSTAYAEPVCARTEVVESTIKDSGGERVFSGLSQDMSHVLEFWVLPSGGWIAVVALPDKRSCVIDGGDHYVGPMPNA